MTAPTKLSKAEKERIRRLAGDVKAIRTLIEDEQLDEFTAISSDVFFALTYDTARALVKHSVVLSRLTILVATLTTILGIFAGLWIWRLFF